MYVVVTKDAVYGPFESKDGEAKDLAEREDGFVTVLTPPPSDEER